ncbi:hypothetical protein BDW59DRAFT_165185 [Aspergillus cavernicola]|uniref:Uncharacterized protein n=1 Tax=Aspergillus cavernicola TaxID=176166 RepID=A0ABR4HU92_9EURO
MTHPQNRARWVKLAILLYRYDIEAGHCLDAAEDFLVFMNLEVAFFPSIDPTRSGTVLHLGYAGPYLLVDELGCNQAV